MSNFHRIIWIDRQIRQKRYPDRQQIADEFEISTRQVARDIEYMKDFMGAPIEYSAFKKGYHYTDDAYILPTQYITTEDKEILKHLAIQYANYGQGQAPQIAELFRRLADDSQSSPPKTPDLPIFPVNSVEKAIYEQLSQAITHRAQVRLLYIDQHYEETERIFCPYKLFVKDTKNYVVGCYPALHNEFGILHLARIRRATLTQEQFTQVSYFSEKDCERKAQPNAAGPYQATILLNAPQKISKLNFPYQRLTDTRFSIQFDNSKELLAALLTRAGDFEIIWPEWLKRKFVHKLQKILNKHI